MNTQENNKLIAKFMGITPNEAGVYHVSKHKGYSLENLLYHTSWDWLMPIVESIFERLDSRDDSANEIKKGMLVCSRNNTYKAVVEFINQYNK
jgi:hypothetical protein